jgi:hypothetical protein
MSMIIAVCFGFGLGVAFGDKAKQKFYEVKAKYWK